MGLIPIALSLAQFVPALMRYLGAGDQSVGVAEKVVNIAQDLTGTTTPEEALERIRASAAEQTAFQEKVLAAQTQLEELYYRDKEDARKRDTELAKAGHRNWRADSMYVLAVVVIIILFVAVWKTPDVSEFVKGVVTLVLGRFLGYLDNMYNFEFGTTRASATKDETIKQLSR